MTNLLTESFANHSIVLENPGSLFSNPGKTSGTIDVIDHNAQ